MIDASVINNHSHGNSGVILLLGVTSRLGSAIFSSIKSKYGDGVSIVTPTRANYTNDILTDVISIVADVQPDIVINTIASCSYGSSVEKRVVNAVLPKIIAANSDVVGYKYIHISSNYVFKSRPYEVTADEEPDICDIEEVDSDDHGPLSYAESKHLAEYYVRRSCYDHMYRIVRIQNLCGGVGKRPDPIERAIEQAPAIMYRNMVVKPSHVRDVADAIVNMFIFDDYTAEFVTPHSIEHIVPYKYMTEKQFMEKVAAHYKLDSMPGYKMVQDNSIVQSVALKPTICIPELVL